MQLRAGSRGLAQVCVALASAAEMARESVAVLARRSRRLRQRPPLSSSPEARRAARRSEARSSPAAAAMSARASILPSRRATSAGVRPMASRTPMSAPTPMNTLSMLTLPLRAATCAGVWPWRLLSSASRRAASAPHDLCAAERSAAAMLTRSPTAAACNGVQPSAYAPRQAQSVPRSAAASSRVRTMSSWARSAAMYSGVSPALVAASGEAPAYASIDAES
mmetsp:Transcript_6113/g.24421  ORF Transcript_6113/g.24421 Transcript_6113/m.24421 type:complete len:222 (-) Transcript_6113:1603-2268(-)